MRALPALAIAAAILMTAACQDTGDPPTVCTTEARPSIAVQIRDSVSGSYVASGATLVIQHDAFIDSMVVPAAAPGLNEMSISTPASAERAGVYDVTVRRAGYVTWTKPDVVVAQGQCHVSTVQLTARLVAAP